eukprot:155954_1
MEDTWSSEDECTHNKTQTPPPKPLTYSTDPFADTDDEQPSPQQKKQSTATKDQRNKPTTATKHGKKEENGPRHSNKELRSPICVVMGHVDAGKTTILDRIRNTNIQSKEPGITQQIGATNLSVEYIKKKTQRLECVLPETGLLLIDTPGHESFSNLRSRGSSMCDLAVLVVDLMHGFKAQTIESLNMLTQRNIPFVVALNKIDRCYDWKPDVDDNAPFLITYNQQNKATQNHFESQLSQVKQQFAEQGLNAKLYHKNKNRKRDVSLVPISGITGEGIPDLLYLITHLTTNYMRKRISFKQSKYKASVLEVKHTRGFGATVDIIMSNGRLCHDDTIMLCGQAGQPIITPIRALLLPHEAQQMQVKGGQYRSVESVSASVGVRIAAVEDLSTAVAGTPLFVVPRQLKGKQRKAFIDKISLRLCKSHDAIFGELSRKVSGTKYGVFVQASTVGCLEALITFLTSESIPIGDIGIGPLAKHAVMKASICQERKYRVILAFNVQCTPDARQLAKEEGVEVLEADVIYHFVDKYKQYICGNPEPPISSRLAVFPVELKIISVIRKKNPLILGVEITRGSLRLNTPICAQKWDQNGIASPVCLGRVESIRSENRDVGSAMIGDKVSVKIVGQETNIEVGRAFAITDLLISEITRESIDALKANFEQEVKGNRDTILHLQSLKKYFNIY